MKIINLFKIIQRPFKGLLFGGMLMLFFALSSSAYAAIPKKGNIAIVVDGMTRSDATPYQIASAEAAIVRELIKKGYKPVDERILKQIRHEKARWFAAEDNVEAIKKLSSQYGVNTTITVRLRVSLRKSYVYEGRASIVLMATSSDGQRLYSGSFDDRKPGHTQEEVEREVMETVILMAISDMSNKSVLAN
jgi:hypothetical protein